MWEGAEWGRFRSILVRPVLEAEFESSDEAVHMMHVEGPISHDGESVERPQVMFVQMVKRALLAAFTNCRLQNGVFSNGSQCCSSGAYFKRLQN